MFLVDDFHTSFSNIQKNISHSKCNTKIPKEENSTLKNSNFAVVLANSHACKKCKNKSL